MKFISRKPSTSHAMSMFTTALTELEAVVANESAEVARIDAEIETLAAQQDAAKARADEAAKFAKRINKIVA